MLRPPILIAFDQKRLREELARQRTVREVTMVTMAYTVDGSEVIQIPLKSYNGLQPGVSRLLDSTLPRFQLSLDDDARIALWSRLIADPLGNHQESWRMLLHEWGRRRSSTWPAAPGISRSLGAAFAREALGIGDTRKVNMMDLALRGRAAPALTKGALMQLAYDLEQEKVTDEIVRDSAKLVVLAVLLLVPFADVPALLGAISTALAGFIQFMQFLEEAESDGEVTEDEVKEAKWSMLGILPFDLVQLVLLFRGLGLLAEAMLSMLLQGIHDLTESWKRRREAVTSGWSGYVESEGESTIFIPDYALP